MELRKDCNTRAKFETLEEAQKAAENALNRRGVELVPYKCKKCGMWHLFNRKFTDSAYSFKKECLGKRVYYTIGMAEKVAAKVLNERGVELHAYSCPHCGHYHLTKRVQQFDRQLF